MRITPAPRRVILTAICLSLASVLTWAVAQMASKPSLAPPQTKGENTIDAAREALAQAQLNAKHDPSKERGIAADEALAQYNQAVSNRIADIFARLKQIDAEIGVPTTTLPFDPRKDMKGAAPAHAEYEQLRSELASLTTTPLAPGNLDFVQEIEPNSTTVTATALGVAANGCKVGSGTTPAGDVDHWSFTAPAGARVWAYVDTGGGQSSPANSRDSFLTLLDTNGTTILEEDDDDGTANGGDSVTESGFSSTISGRTLAAGGTYFLQVRGFGPTSVFSPYRLFVVVTTAAGSAEVEANNTPATANPIILTGATLGQRSGSISPAGDVDFYSLTGDAGDNFYISADGNPERDATNTDLVINIINFDGVTGLMVPPADSGLGGSPTNPEGEAFNFTLPRSGTFFVRVSGFGTSTGTYDLTIAKCSLAGACPPTQISSTLGSPTPGAGYTVTTGTQLGRLNRFVDQTGACNNIRTCPGNFTLVGARPFDAYTFVNGPSPRCVTVAIDAQACLVNNFLVVAAYLGPYDPASQCTNYLADIGGSPNPTGVFSFNVPASATLTLVITAANASPTVCGTGYRLSIDLCIPCTITCPANINQSNDPNQCGAVVNYPAPTTTGTCGTVTCSPASGSFFPVGTTTVTCTTTAGPGCTFTVTVVDTQPPSITCPANITAVTSQVCAAPGGGGACQVVTFPLPTATDNCPGVTAVCVPPSGTCLPPGVTTVTCTATDASGNTATCSFTVTVFDVAVQDDSDPSIVLLWNSVTGAYRFCCQGITFTGVGKATIQGCVFTLQHNPADRRVLGRVDKAVHAGTASIQFPPGSTRCTITDRNTLNDMPTCQ